MWSWLASITWPTSGPCSSRSSPSCSWAWCPWWFPYAGALEASSLSASSWVFAMASSSPSWLPSHLNWWAQCRPRRPLATSWAWWPCQWLLGPPLQVRLILKEGYEWGSPVFPGSSLSWILLLKVPLPLYLCFSSLVRMHETQYHYWWKRLSTVYVH